MFDDAQKYLEMAVKKETEYAPYYYILGNISERKDKLDKAEEYYKLAVKYQSDYFEPNYNLGVIYYNKAAKQIETVNALTSKTEYEIEKPKIDEYFKISLGYYENAYKAKPDEIETLKSLEFLYNRFNMTDKLKVIQQKLGK
ncbi:MAG: hypothetical protein HY738_11450 [Bacteroidia bacterium]|nr:hypothetical protein [Bacteroidia bacterium]